MIDTAQSNLFQYIEQPKQSLLIVDDQPFNIQLLQHIFAAHYQVFTATNSDSAIDLCRANQPDLVLLNVDMPVLNGYDVCRQLKTDPSTSHIPVVFITTLLNEKVELRGLDAGAVDFITKPLNARVILARVKTHITMKRQTELLKKMAFVDGMTGLYNRRFFDDRVESEFHRSRRTGSFLSILLVDVDDFNHYNEQYGHQKGDDSLRRIADRIKKSCRRPADFVARFDGAKLACMLPDTPVNNALPFAQYLERQVRDLAIEHINSTVNKVVTISLGVVSRNNGVGQSGALVSLAEAALQRAKEQGRARAWCALD
jgi:diguanylate cyclase (GGDEF)-like protein